MMTLERCICPRPNLLEKGLLEFRDSSNVYRFVQACMSLTEEETKLRHDSIIKSRKHELTTRTCDNRSRFMKDQLSDYVAIGILLSGHIVIIGHQKQ